MSVPLTTTEPRRRFTGRLEREILAQAERTPDATAFRRVDRPVTYRELASIVRAVASRLRERGVAPGDRVALLCNRGGDGLLGALGTLLCGCIYVPVPPEYPLARIEHILCSSGARVVLADLASAGTAALLAGDAARIELEELLACDGGLGESYTPGPDAGESSEPAYILFTSGSTGRPKGVVVSHDAVLNTLSWMADEFRLGPGEVIGQKTSWGFTDSLWELFFPLLVGGEIAFIEDEVVRDPLALYRALRDSRSVLTQFVPPVLSVFLTSVRAAVEKPSLPDLRWVLNGGEELPRSLVESWFQAFPSIGIANSYGMTESAIYATCYFMREPPVFGVRRIPVGRPIPGARVYVLGASGDPLDVDRVGEVCVGGDGIMQGYCNDPELTRAAFTRHPVTGERLYRTGDLGAWRPDGNLAYLGRADKQVKVRGMRVELGEVEHALLRHPAVKHAAVVTTGEGEARCLHGFYTVQCADPGAADLLMHLRGLLPEFMIPSRLMVLDALPLTAHGKVDRGALAALTIPAPARAPYAAPTRDSVEEVIWAAWREALGQEDFDLDQGFFEAGGNSLLLVQVYAALLSAYRGMLVLPDLLRYPTIRSLSERIREAIAARGPDNAPVDGERRGRADLEARRTRRGNGQKDRGKHD